MPPSPWWPTTRAIASGINPATSMATSALADGAQREAFFWTKVASHHSVPMGCIANRVCSGPQAREGSAVPPAWRPALSPIANFTWRGGRASVLERRWLLTSNLGDSRSGDPPQQAERCDDIMQADMEGILRLSRQGFGKKGKQSSSEWDAERTAQAYAKVRGLCKQRMRDGPEKGLLNQVFMSLQNHALAHVEGLLPWHVCIILGSHARMNCLPDVSLRVKLEKHAEHIMGLFDSQRVAKLLWVYATMRTVPGGGLLKALSDRMKELSQCCSAQDVANILWAYSRLEVFPGADNLRMMGHRAEDLADSLNPDEVTMILYAFAKLREAPGSRLLELLSQRAFQIMPDFNAHNSANMVWAFGMLGETPSDELLGGLVGRLLVCAESCSPKEVSKILCAFAMLGVHPGVQLVDLLWKRAIVYVHRFSMHEYSLAVWALLSIGETPGEILMEHLKRRLFSEMRFVNAHTAANILWSFAASGEHPGSYLIALLRKQVKLHIDFVTNEDLAMVMYALASFGESPGHQLAEPLVMRATGLACRLRPQQLAIVMWAFAELGQDGGAELQDALRARALEIAWELDTRDLAYIMWALAVVPDTPGEALMDLCERAVQVLSNVDERTASREVLVHMGMIHEALCSCTIEKRFLTLPGGPGVYLKLERISETCRKAFDAVRASPTVVRKQVSSAVRDLSVECEEGFIDSQTGYALDVIVRTASCIIAIELEGPTCFVNEHDRKVRKSMPKVKRGSICVRRKLLKLRGYKIISVPYWEWDAAVSFGDSKAYICELLNGVGIETGSHRVVRSQSHTVKALHVPQRDMHLRSDMQEEDDNKQHAFRCNL